MVEPARATDASAVRGATVERTTAIEDTLELSPEAMGQLRAANFPAQPTEQPPPIAGQGPAPEAASSASPPKDGVETNSEKAVEGSPEERPDGSTKELTEEQQAQVTELKQRDAEVRAHEQAHVAAGGQYVTGGPTYQYQKGPDGRRYAVGGEVQIDTSPVDGDPEATIQKAQVVRAAALAPAEPSSQDLAVAAAATQMAAQARAELRDPSPASETTEDDAEQPSVESTDDNTSNEQAATSQTNAQQVVVKAISAYLKTPETSLFDVYA